LHLLAQIAAADGTCIAILGFMILSSSVSSLPLNATAVLLATFALGCGASPGSSPDAGTTADAPPSNATPQACEFVIAPPADHLQLIASDHSACLYIARTDICGAGNICKAVPYQINKVIAVVGTAKSTLTDTTKLTWNPTHHNWNDTASFVDTVGNVTLELVDKTYEDIGNIRSRWLLSGKRNGQTIWGPIHLEAFAPK
jgi:hypothetical protein